MKTIVTVGIFLVILVGIAGVIAVGVGLSEISSSEGPTSVAVGFAILGSDFVFVMLLALLNGVAEIRDVLVPPEPKPLAPVISGVSPTSYPCLNGDQTMTIDGSNFRSGVSLTFAGPRQRIESLAHKLSFVSSSQLIYQFNNGGEGVGTWNVRVSNPDGKDSNWMRFTVTVAGKPITYTPPIDQPTGVTAYPQRADNKHTSES
jgi:hypothetical protein